MDLKSYIPTPMAKALLRIERANSDHEKFMTCENAYEALLKYVACISFSQLNMHDPDRSFVHEHKASRADSIGVWHGVLLNAIEDLRSVRVDDWFFEFMKWLDSDVKKNAINLQLKEAVDKTRDYLSGFGPKYKNDIKKIKDVFAFLVFLRNKTRGHGALPPSYYHRNAPLLEVIIGKLCETCPLMRVSLLSPDPSHFSRARILVGAIPSDNVEFKAATIHYEESTLFINVAGDNYFLPPLIHYFFDDDAVWFANSAYDELGYSLEFIELLTGNLKTISIKLYAQEPIEKRKSVKAVIKFPAHEVVSTIFVQNHCPEVIKNLLANVPKAIWHHHPLKIQYEAKLPEIRGVYCLISHAHSAGLEAHKVLGYVGQTGNLKNRFREYISEGGSETGRERVREFIKRFPDIHFYYTAVDQPEDQTNLEEWMIKAIDPFANTVLRLSVAEVKECFLTS
jgi:hypothetical protein